MAMNETPLLRQTISSQTRSDSIRINKGRIILDIGSGSTCTVDVKMMNGAWIPLCDQYGTAYSYTSDVALLFDGQGAEYSINVPTYSAAVEIEIHAGH